MMIGSDIKRELCGKVEMIRLQYNEKEKKSRYDGMMD